MEGHAVHETDQPEVEQKPRAGPQEGQQQAFGQQLPHDATPSRAEGEPNGQLLLDGRTLERAEG